MVIATGPARTLGTAEGARLRFGEQEKAEGVWAGTRMLFLDEQPAFELSFWCGTCQFLFQREPGANETVSPADLEVRLGDGIDDLDEEIVGQFAALLSVGEYVPLLLRVQPRLVRPGEPGDYFSEEQVATWGLEAFYGLPTYPRTPYYRTTQSTDYFTHWGLTHFLLDGHHKFQAAAESGRPLQLLSLLSVDGSLADAESVARVPELRARSHAARASGRLR